MSKVLHLLDWNDLLSYRHEKWIVAEMKEQEKLEDENIQYIVKDCIDDIIFSRLRQSKPNITTQHTQ